MNRKTYIARAIWLLVYMLLPSACSLPVFYFCTNPPGYIFTRQDIWPAIVIGAVIPMTLLTWFFWGLTARKGWYNYA